MQIEMGTEHDTLAFRLANILARLNMGERLEPRTLATDFGVNLRTIQRDLNERFSYLPICKEGGRYFLAQEYLGKIGLEDVRRFAHLAGVGGLFPDMGANFLSSVFGGQVADALLVKGHNFEKPTQISGQFFELEKAVSSGRKVDFHYLRHDKLTAREGLEPYRLVNSKGVWYLFASEHGKLKSFSVSKIRAINVRAELFERDSALDAKIDREDGVWIGQPLQKLELEASSEISEYFQRRKILPNQGEVQAFPDGRVKVFCEAATQRQIFPIIRYWLPYLKIIAPVSWALDFSDDLRRACDCFEGGSRG